MYTRWLSLAFVVLFFNSKFVSTTSRNKTGACEPREFFDDDENDSTIYWQCKPKSLEWNGVGQWENVICPTGLGFSKRLQGCQNSSTIRRQSICQPGFTGRSCMPGCTASNSNGIPGGQCNWLTAPLARNPYTSAGFLQCTSGRSGNCGAWQQVPCAPGTVFNQQIQVCATNYLQSSGTCGVNSQPVCPCGSNNICPSGCSCNQGTCCQQTRPIPQISTCSGGIQATRNCYSSSQCGSGYQCQSGGCCPRSQPIYRPTCSSGALAMSSCYGIGQSNCNSGYQCQNGGCCQSSCPDGSSSVRSCLSSTDCPLRYSCMSGRCCRLPLPHCLNGIQAGTQCGGPGSCPNNQYCYQGGCCSIPRCGTGQLALQACTGGMTCPQGSQCSNNACCPMPLPTCPIGRCSGPCRSPTGCGSGQYCYVDSSHRQGCCPTPSCPNGRTAIAPCTGGATCPSGYGCMNQACCPRPTCPGGQTGLQSCYGSGIGNCPQGNTCQNNVCCPIPQCPGGSPALQMCSGVGNSCPRGSNCRNSVCCQMSTCPGGLPAASSCAGGGCSPGYQCINGGCCNSQTSLPSCPGGQSSLGSCSGFGQSSCPLGYQCQSGGCCRSQIQICSSGMPSIQSCGIGGGCPRGHNCNQGQCCPHQMIICPNGQQATQLCAGFGRGVCPTGFQCSGGGCCPSMNNLPVSTCQSSFQQPVCYCAAYNNRCPATTSCMQGTCCAGQSSPYYNTMRPGDRCQRRSQCGGSSSNCYNGYCVCTGGSRSNGVSCVPFKRRKQQKPFKPGKSCGQFGTQCTVYAEMAHGKRSLNSAVRRKPLQTMAALGIKQHTEPVFWYTFSPAEHYCNTSNDCTPDMTCIKNKCYPYLVLGDSGCKHDEQCNRTTNGAACVNNRNHNTTLCLCSSNFYLYNHNCWSKCPSETEPQGDICIPKRVNKKVDREQTPNLKEFANQILHLFSGQFRSKSK